MANGLLSNSNGSNTDILTVTVYGGVNHDSTLSGNGTSGSPLGVVTPGDAGVNSYVHNNSATIDDINEVVQSNSAQWSTEFDPSYLSAQIDNKLNERDFTAWQSGQYATDLQTVEGQINNKLDTSSFSEVSGSFLTDINIPESATWNEVSQAYEQASGTYLTSVYIPESATWNDVSTAVQTNSAQWSDNTGDEEVNEFVYNNSATINEVNTSYKTNSGTFLTAVDLTPYQPKSGMVDYQTTAGMVDYAKTSSVHDYVDSAISGKLDTTAFSTVSGDFLVASSLNGYATVSFVEYVTGDIIDLIPTDYVSNETLEQTSGNIVNLIPDTSEFITNASAESTYQPIGNYLSSNALDGYATQDWVTAQGYITGVNIPESGTWNDVASAYQTNSSTYLTAVDLTPYATTSELNSTSSYLSGAIDYVSANAGGSPSGFVSGSNVLFVPNSEWNPGQGKVYSANISGDITVTYGDYWNSGENINIYATYSLSSVGSQIGNKLNKNVIEDSKTLTKIDDKAEVYSFAYRPSEFVTTGITADNYSTPNYVSFHIGAPYPYKLYSASLVIESDGFNENSIPNGWNFVNSANGSATFSRFYKDQSSDNINFNGFWNYNLTNASAYAVACSGFVTDALAFKSDLTAQGGNAEVESYVINNSATIDDVNTTYQTNSASYITAHQDLSDYVPVSSYNELKSSYDDLSASYATLSSLFATFSGQWLLPNTGV